MVQVAPGGNVPQKGQEARTRGRDMFHGGFPELREPLWGSHNKDYSTLGCVGVLFGKLPYLALD